MPTLFGSRGRISMANDVVGRAWTELEPHLSACGFELVEVEYLQFGGRWILRFYIDRPGGVTLDHCAEVSHLLGPILDEADFIDNAYVLEVSSPGIDRPVRKLADFQRFTGETIRLKTQAAVSGRRQFQGVIKDTSDGMVILECDGEQYGIHLDNVKSARLVR